MRLDHLRTTGLIVISIAIGLIGWSGNTLLFPVATLFPAIWAIARTRWQAAAVSAAYFLAASRGLPQGVANFYSSDIWRGLLLWLIASAGFVIVHAALWTPCGGRRKPLRFLMACVVMAVPPFGITGWAHPMTAAGILFPTWGWWGLAAMAAALGVMTTRCWPAAVIAMTGFWLWSAAQWTAPNLSASWVGVDLEFGASLGRDAGLERQRALIDAVRAHPPGSTIVLPESALGFWTVIVAGLWQSALEGTDITVIAGAAEINDSGYDNVLVKISSGGSEVLYRERMPVPGSMWQPWRALHDGGGGAKAHFFANPVVEIEGIRLAPLICYEQLLVWPILQSALHEPDAIVAIGNGWWTSGTSIIDIQRASSEAWARLFDLSLVISFNT
ncbi:hypothetical protein LPJGGPFB_05155 [Ensifer adhaerens]|uniref:conjugal transfer protein TraB n=1 Tax=Ensifer adhaerens TaxID=106592 RepID=UPI00156820DE|nr:conjugal transfer protein TraB [Ensifer adhaerens]NRP21896.1 hypothetical protein [Ensifer adhaerens]